MGYWGMIVTKTPPPAFHPMCATSQQLLHAPNANHFDRASSSRWWWPWRLACAYHGPNRVKVSYPFELRSPSCCSVPCKLQFPVCWICFSIYKDVDNSCKNEGLAFGEPTT